MRNCSKTDTGGIRRVNSSCRRSDICHPVVTRLQRKSESKPATARMYQHFVEGTGSLIARTVSRSSGNAIRPIKYGSSVCNFSHPIKVTFHYKDSDVVVEANFPTEIGGSFEDIVHQPVRRKHITPLNQG